MEANPASIQAAIDWVVKLVPKGGTDILLAVQNAGGILSNPSFAGDNRIPMVFLITDGAVSNEKLIHQWVVGNCQHVRFHTLGIGDFANAYFLKRLAMAGRGLNDHIVDFKHIFKQVLSLIRASTTPILTNVEVLLPVQSNQYEIFPYPVPDLYCGYPLMISGKVAVNFDHVLIRGLLPNNQPYQVQVRPQMTNVLLHKVFARQRLDYFVGQAWVSNKAEDIQAVTRMSAMYCLPTPFTVMVAYHKNLKKRNQSDQSPLSVGELVLISVGGVILLAGLAFTLGDIAGTLAGVINVMAIDTFGYQGATMHANMGTSYNCCDCMNDACCCCCNNDPCCGCCRSNRNHHHNNNQTTSSSWGNSGGDPCCYWGSGYGSSGTGNSGCCDCCCNCGTGNHAGDCNGCCCNVQGCDAGNCGCCGCDGGCVNCANCSCDGCGDCCDCNCGGCSDCNCDCCGGGCGGCDCGGCGGCDCGGCSGGGDCNCGGGNC